ncbi:hypothetical protein [Streptomyces sp. NPDC093984]|uniref:hypothetical protein n=1 Tax=Streptomyces sp. NPDC093984 TaxID=3366052 RepID=UPI00381C5C85
MALAKKGTRLITVDDRRYRWVVAPDDEPGLAIVVEDADAPAQRMVTWVEHGTVITPELLARAIRRARGLGWTPRQRGPQFTTRWPGIPGSGPGAAVDP